MHIPTAVTGFIVRSTLITERVAVVVLQVCGVTLAPSAVSDIMGVAGGGQCRL